MEKVLTSWRGRDDPGSGNFTFMVDIAGNQNAIIVNKEGTTIYWKSLVKFYKLCWKNSIEWIRNWCFLCSLEDVIISGENLSLTLEMIENMSLSWILGWALGMYGLGPLIQLIIIFYYWVSVCAQKLSLKQCFQF